MPRNPAAKKNQHSHKHENGLVGPGKRVTKQKSNGHINGGPKDATTNESPTAAGDSATPPMTSQSNNISSSSLSEAKPEGPVDPRRLGLKKQDSDSSYDIQHDHQANGAVDMPPRSQPPTVAKSKSSRDVNHLQIASSILRSSPACDTVAILIFLLALPSMVLTIVQALFASLTLMPPAGVSPGSLLSLFDVFQGSAGAPSLGTMVIVDVICFGLWFCLWGWAQSFAVDLAQVQIAMTLGSGSAGKSSSVNTACVAIVLLLHSIRSKGVRQFLYSRFVPTKVLAHGRLAQLTQLVPSEADFGNNIQPAHWIRSLFALHILSQALMAFVRRRVTSTLTASAAKSSKRADADPVIDSVNDLTGGESRPNPATASGVDYALSSTGLKDGKDRAMTAKKKRRQANQVRSRQPFWAAVASTKVHVMREYEHKKSLSRTVWAQEGVPDASSSEEVVWVTQVDSSTIAFEASNIPFPDQDQESALPATYKPFYVRVNGARWLAVYLEPSENAEHNNQWNGEISRLAPNCTYTCSFVHAEDDEEFASVTVKTPALSEKEMSASQGAAPTRQPLRPSSPTTTLKTSISTAEAKLNDARSRLLKTRRSHKAALAKVERDVEAFNARLKSSGDDVKQRQKLMQAEQSMRRTEDAASSIQAALEDLEAIPEEDSEEYISKKTAFEEQNDYLNSANESLTAAKASAKQELDCVKNELSSLSGRKERLTSRHARLMEQHDRITQANAQGMNEKERKAAESAAKQAEQQKIEADYLQFFNSFNRDIQQLQAQTSQAWQEIQHLERQAQMQRDLAAKNAHSLHTENHLPGTDTNPPQSATYRPLNFGYHNATTLPSQPQSPEALQASPFLPFARTVIGGGNRSRSGTTRSLGAHSGYSENFEDADPIPPMPSPNDFDGSGRNSRGSSRGQNSGSPGIIGTGPGQASLGSPARGNHSPGRGQMYGGGHINTW